MSIQVPLLYEIYDVIFNRLDNVIKTRRNAYTLSIFDPSQTERESLVSSFSERNFSEININISVSNYHAYESAF